MSKKTVYTIGYEGRTQDEFIKILVENRIEQLVDVRHITSSRKKGFSMNQLAEGLQQAGMKYAGMRELGTPDEMRREYKAGGSEVKFAKDYAAYIDSQPDKLEELKRHVRERTSVLMCYERDPKLCHRMILAMYLEHEGFQVNHLP